MCVRVYDREEGVRTYARGGEVGVEAGGCGAHIPPNNYTKFTTQNEIRGHEAVRTRPHKNRDSKRKKETNDERNNTNLIDIDRYL